MPPVVLSPYHEATDVTTGTCTRVVLYKKNEKTPIGELSQKGAGNGRAKSIRTAGSTCRTSSSAPSGDSFQSVLCELIVKSKYVDLC